jgi:hypothetical protein
LVWFLGGKNLLGRSDLVWVVIGAWRKDQHEERPKKALGGLTLAAYARQLAMNAVTVDLGL